MAALVGHRLEEAGYATRWFRNATEYRRRQGSEAIDLLLLDWMLPDGTGIESWLALALAARSIAGVESDPAADANDADIHQRSAHLRATVRSFAQ